MYCKEFITISSPQSFSNSTCRTWHLGGTLASADRRHRRRIGGVAVFLEEDGEAGVAHSDRLGGGREGQLVVAARVAEYLPARSAVMLQRVTHVYMFEVWSKHSTEGGTRSDIEVLFILF